MSMQLQGVNQYYNPYYNVDPTQDYFPINQTSGSIFNPATTTTTKQPAAKEPEKKLGFFDKLWNGVKGAVKGVVKGVGNIVKGIIDNPLKTIAMVGACFIPGVGPFIAAGLCAYGIATSAPGVIKGVVGVATAETAEQAEAAGESIGENGLTLGLSVAGLRTSLGAVKAAHAGGKAALVEGAGLRTNAFNYAKGATGLDSVATWGQLGQGMARGTWNNMKTFGRTVRDTAQENNPFSKAGRQHIADSARARYDYYNNIHETRVAYKAKMDSLAQSIKDSGTLATPEQLAQLKQMQQLVELTRKPSYFDSMNTFRNNRLANDFNGLKNIDPAQLTAEQAARLQAYEAYTPPLTRISYIPTQPLNYGSFGTLTPVAANLSTPEEQVSAATTPQETQGIPLSYAVPGYNY